MRNLFRRNAKKDYDDAIQVIHDHVKSLNDTIDRLNTKLREYSKDEEVAKLSNKVEAYRKHSLLMLSPLELEAIQKFKSTHYESCKNGSKFEYTLIGTGIGTGIVIKCPACGESKDVTDSASW